MCLVLVPPGNEISRTSPVDFTLDLARLSTENALYIRQKPHFDVLKRGRFELSMAASLVSFCLKGGVAERSEILKPSLVTSAGPTVVRNVVFCEAYAFSKVCTLPVNPSPTSEESLVIVEFKITQTDRTESFLWRCHSQ